MKWLFFIVLIIITACKSKETTKRELFESKLRTFLYQGFRELDSTDALDSVKLIKIDTVSKRQCYSIKASSLEDSMNYYKQRAEIELQQAHSHYRLAELYAGLSSTLFRQNKEDGLQKARDAEVSVESGKRLLFLYDTLIAKAKRADSITPIFLEIKCAYQLRHKDASIKRDTAFVYTTPDFEILKREDFNEEISMIK